MRIIIALLATYLTIGLIVGILAVVGIYLMVREGSNAFEQLKEIYTMGADVAGTKFRTYAIQQIMIACVLWPKLIFKNYHMDTDADREKKMQEARDLYKKYKEMEKDK